MSAEQQSKAEGREQENFLWGKQRAKEKLEEEDDGKTNLRAEPAARNAMS